MSDNGSEEWTDHLPESLPTNAQTGAGFNQFFLPNPNRPRRSGQVFAAYEVPEPTTEHSEQEPEYLECIDSEWLHEQLRYRSLERFSYAEWLNLTHDAPLSVIELGSFQLPATEGASPGQVLWYQLKYERSQNSRSNARVYKSLFSEGYPIRITEATAAQDVLDNLRPPDFADWLNERLAAYARSGHATWRDDHRYMLGLNLTAGIAVYDVGQGSWQAILDKDTKLPLVYLDVGGGVLVNKATFPTGFGEPCTVSLTILSHWDWDHWSSAYRFPKLLQASWLAPPVPDTPIQIRAAEGIRKHGKLVIWSQNSHQPLEAGCIRIEKCVGSTQNNSGLVVTVQSRSYGGHRCLVPGDAAYKFIPSVTNGEEVFDALCMTHHGGRLHSDDYPLPRGYAVSANSSGPRNTYKHPLFATLFKHTQTGWPMPAQTAISGSRPCHVYLPWGESPEIVNGSCELVGLTVKHAAASVKPVMHSHSVRRPERTLEPAPPVTA